MCKVISVSNQKGGVGKTVTCVNLGIGLAREGKKVLMIDADPQGSLSISLGFDEPDKLDVTLGTILLKVINDEEFDLSLGILHHDEGVDVLPGNIELSGLEISINGVISRETILKQYVDRMREFYDYIIIDCMPSLGLLTINALACADSVLIPVQASYLPVKGLQQLIKTIGRVKRQLNPKLEIEGILLTMVDNRTNYAKDVASQVYEAYSNNTDSNLNLSVTLCKDTTVHPSLMGSDEIDVNAYARIVRRNLEIDLLIQNSPFEEETFEGIYELVLETVISQGDSMVIGSNRYPMSLVRSKFLKLNSSHVEYVMDSLKANTTKVRNMKKYMLATLFNAPTTISSYYQAEVFKSKKISDIIVANRVNNELYDVSDKVYTKDVYGNDL